MIANFRFKILAVRKTFETRRKKYTVQNLQKPSVREEFTLELKNRFLVLSTQNEDIDTETRWKAIKNVYIETSEKTLGFRENQQKEWISEETWKEKETRKVAKENVNRSKTRQQKISAQTQYSEINKRCFRKDKRNWINEQAKQAEELERKGDINELYNITRKLSQRKFRMNRLTSEH